MLHTAIPARFGIPWAASAGGAFITYPVPQASQIGVTPGRASLTDGYPPLNFTQIGAGGVPPFGQDTNGILKQVTLWNQWHAAGAPIFYDSTFATAIGGYPEGAVLLSTGLSKWWYNQVENNTVDPDGAGTNWIAFRPLFQGVEAGAGTYTRPKFTLDAFGAMTAAANGAQPTYQKFTSGSGTYTPTAGTVRARVRMCGGGGGGVGGGNGSATSLGGWTAAGGSGGASGTPGSGAGGAGGTGGSNGTGTLVDRQAGGAGVNGISFTGTAISGAIGTSGMLPGGLNRLGGGPNSGQGGPGGGSVNFNNSSVITGGAGGAGEFVEFDIINPGALSYAVGAGAGNGQAGVILIMENYD